MECLQLGVNYYTEEGRFSIAAKYQKEIAEAYEAEGDLENAMDAFEAAADFYEGEGSQTYVSLLILCVFFFCLSLSASL